MSILLDDFFSYSSFIHNNTKIECIISEDLINYAYQCNPNLVDINKSLISKENEKLYLKLQKIDKFFINNFKTPLNKFICDIKIFNIMPNNNYDELGIDCFYNYNSFMLKNLRIILGYNNYKYSLIVLLKYCIYAYFIKYYEMLFNKGSMHISNNEINKKTLYLIIDFYSEYVFANSVLGIEESKRLKYFNKKSFRILMNTYKKYSNQNDFIKYVFSNKDLFIDMINENYENRKKVNLFSIDNNERNDVQ